jgi:hypothetical protein
MGRRTEALGLVAGLARSAAEPRVPRSSFGAPGMIDPSIGEVEWDDSTPAGASAVSQLATSPRGFDVSVNTRAFSKGAPSGQLAGWQKVASGSEAASECAFS